MPELNLFDDISAIGLKFFNSTDRGFNVLSDYTWQLASICDLIKHTHLIVIGKLEEIIKADSLDEAKAATQVLNGRSLSDSFHASGLCDLFAGYGKALRRIVENDLNAPELQNLQPISQQEKYKWIEFCDTLEERERQVAILYTKQIQGLREIVMMYPGGSLNEIKEHAKIAKNILTGQVADFDVLAANFRKLVRV